MADTTQETAKRGLQDIVAGTTSISFIDGQQGRLIYRGYSIHDLVKGTFEEVVYLLLYGDLPTRSQLESFITQIRSESTLPDEVIERLRTLPRDVNPMEALRNLVGALSFNDSESDDNSHEANIRKAVRLIAKLPLIVALLHRHRNGRELKVSQMNDSIAANFMAMIFDEPVKPEISRMLDIALILHADHEFNASTFTARVIAATLSDMYSAVVGAIGALKGPLHGGANERVMRMLIEIGSVDNARAWIDQALEQKKKIMGFGHRVYRTEDPRATHLRRMSEQIGKEKGETKWFDMSQVIEKEVMDKKGLNPNVDFYSASTYYMMGIPLELFTPIFAMSRVAGWSAHVIEQQDDNRLIRPAAEYIGPTDRTYEPIDER